MPTHDEEHELDFVNYQEVKLKHVLPKQDRTVSKDDYRFMAKSAKSIKREAKAIMKEDKRRGIR